MQLYFHGHIGVRDLVAGGSAVAQLLQRVRCVRHKLAHKHLRGRDDEKIIAETKYIIYCKKKMSKKSIILNVINIVMRDNIKKT